MKKKIFLALGVAILSGAAYGFYLFNKPHQSLSDATPDFKLNSEVLITAYENDEKTANTKYLGKIIEVTGVVSEKTKDDKGKVSLTLAGPDLAGIGCDFENKAIEKTTKLNVGDQVKIKGTCTGILMDVVLVDCVVSE
ncbi:MAG: hypothetical protein IPP51_06120 [Bacteroidetes bacterium]|nr:hypothetical protein [Bacteroidota bacterium]